MQNPPLRIIVNPAARGGRGRKAATELLQVLADRAIPCDPRYTTGPGHAVELAAEAARDGLEKVAVVGGDGTMHEVAEGLLNSGRNRLPAIALFPVGTGNDFHRMVGAAGTAAGVAELLTTGTVERFDVGRVWWRNGETFFVNLFGVGIDVDILECRSRFTWLPGLLQYLAALLNALLTFRAPEVEIEMDDVETERRIRARTTLSVITVGPSIGGGFMINPSAAASDGKLDLCHLPALNVPQVLALVPKVIRGVHGSSPLVTMRQLRRASLRRPDGGALRFEVDGEIGPAPARELHVEVVPGALSVLAPARA